MPTQSHTTNFPSRLNHFAPATICALFLAFPVLSAPTLAAQTLTIKLVNANSGKPMHKQNITVQWSVTGASFTGLVDKHGELIIQVPPHEEGLFLTVGPRLGKEPDRIAYIDCNESADRSVSVAQATANGVVPRNVCTKRTAPPRHGVIIFWAQPRPFFDMQ